MKAVLSCLLVVCVISFRGNVKAEQNALQSIALAIAKGKEIIDRGIKIQSERQDSVDFFGTKVDTSYGVKQGFGDAVKEGSTDSFEEDLVRKKRTIDVLEYLRSQGLFTNSASGTNVNFVKISSVSNVNNFGPAPEATTVASRRRRSLKYAAADETVSIMTSDDEMKPDGSFRGRTAGETHEAHVKKMMLGFGKGDLKKSANKRMVPVLYKSWDEKVSGYLSESRMKPGGSLKTHTISQSDDTRSRGVVVGGKSAGELDEQVPMRYERSLGDVRSKRSPQDIEEDVTTEKPRCKGRGKGGPGGRRGGGRGRGPPPPPPEDDDEEDDERKKREVKQSSQNDVQGYSGSSTSKSSVRSTSSSSSQTVTYSDTNSSSKPRSDSDSEGSDSDSSSSSDSDSSSDYSSESSEMEPNSASEVTDDGPSTPNSIRSKRDPCAGRRQQQGTTTMASEQMRRAKRDVSSEVEGLDEEQQKVHSWFNTVVETIVESAKRVSAAVRRVFGRGEQEGQGPLDAESYEASANPHAETLE